MPSRRACRLLPIRDRAIRGPLRASRVASAALLLFAAGGCGETRLYPIRVVDDAAVAGFDAPDELPAGFTCPASQAIGFAAAGSGTTGGGDTPPVTVATEDELRSYAEAGDEPQVIQIAAVIVVTKQVRVRSNKTIRGLIAGAGLVNAGVYLKDVENVILQRLTISRAIGDDAIGIDNAHNVWIDHCDLSSELASPKGTYDGLVDIKHAARNVTVSWTHLHDHYDSSLVGHSPDNAAEDTGALTVTYHHDWFVKTVNSSPRVRFGSVHVFNNFYETGIQTAVISQSNANVLVEGSVFRDVLHPIVTEYLDGAGAPSEPPGRALQRDNSFDRDHPPEIGEMGRTSDWMPDYPYTLDPTAMVPALVSGCAGARF